MNNKSNFIKKSTIIIFLMIIFLPLIQSWLKIIPEPTLNGVTKPIISQRFIWKNWFNKEIQNYLELWLDNNLGLKSYFIKTNNQLNFWLFNETHQKTQTQILIGKNNYLYEKNYIDTYLGVDAISQEKLEQRISQLKILQDLLKDRKIVFFLLISPSKASFYPEFLPTNQLASNANLAINTNYQKTIPLLSKYKINFFDSHNYFISIKKTVKHPLFAKAGTHWTAYGSCLATQKIIDKTAILMNKNFDFLNCENVEISSTPLYRDKDLLELSNLWFTGKFNEQLAYPKIQKTFDSKINNIKMLIIGDSFTWNMLPHISSSSFVDNCDFYYYFNSQATCSDKTLKPINKNYQKLKQEILNHNLIVIEANESALTDIGFGFIDTTLEVLK